jgi:hypothetical protein
MVNTFLLCRDFRVSASLLNDQRLNKQLVEAKQIIDANDQSRCQGQKKKIGFLNHPASIQWRNHLDGLKYYYNVHRQEALDRGFLIKTSAYALGGAYAPPFTPLCSPLPSPPSSLSSLPSQSNGGLKGGEVPLLGASAPPPLPWFVDCPHYWYSHCASLYRKQSWFYKNLEFPKIYLNHGYFWPSHVDGSSGTKVGKLEEKYSAEYIQQYIMLDIKNNSTLSIDLDSFLKKHCDAPTLSSLSIRCSGTVKSGDRKGLRCINALAAPAVLSTTEKKENKETKESKESKEKEEEEDDQLLLSLKRPAKLFCKTHLKKRRIN